MKASKIKAMIFSVIFLAVIGSFYVYADKYSGYIGECGSDGDNVTFTLNIESGLLMIEGNGAMADYRYGDPVPWEDDRELIKSIKISDEVTHIGSDAFAGCSNVKNVELPNNLKSIGDGAFASCRSLESITIPKNTEEIKCSFVYCTSLRSIKVEAKNPAYCDIDGVLFTKDKKTLLRYPAKKDGKKYTVPSSVTVLSRNAFSQCYALESISVPNSVTEIGAAAFSGCEALKNIKIPAKVKNIGAYTFYLCKSLSDVILPEGIESLEEFAFFGCEELQKIEFPKSLISIGTYAFENCKSLKEVTLTDKITNIGQFAFSGCDSLKSLRIPGSIKTVEYHAFARCRSLSVVIIEEGVKSIKSGAFELCSGLKELRIPSSLTGIEADVLRGCTSLLKITIDENNPAYCVIDGVLFSKDRTTLVLYPENGAPKYVIPDGVTFIGESSFSGCSFLEAVTIPEGVKEIGKYAFSGCDSLSLIAIPESTEVICGSAFSGCRNLSTFIIRSKNIVFDYNTRDACIVVDNTFYNCDKLDAVYIYKDGNAKDYFKKTDFSIMYLDGIVMGDIDSNGSVNIKDALLLAKYLERGGSGVNNLSADCNLDGKIDHSDFDILALYLAKCISEIK